MSAARVRVAIVEDQRDIREGLRFLIDGTPGYACAGAFGAMEPALAALSPAVADIVLMDLGAGTSFNIIDFFLVSDVGILTVVPEPTSIENGYRFIKSALYRKLRGAAPTEAVRTIVDSALDQKNPLGIRSPLDLLAAVEREDPPSVAILKQQMNAFHPRFVVNQVRGRGQGQGLFQRFERVATRFLTVELDYVGEIPEDPFLRRSIREQRPVVQAYPSAPASVALKTLALRADMWPVAEGPRGNVEFFVERLIRRPSVRLEVVR